MNKKKKHGPSKLQKEKTLFHWNWAEEKLIFQTQDTYEINTFMTLFWDIIIK